MHKGPLADFAIGKAITIARGSDVCLLSTGNMLPEAIEAAHQLEQQGISAEVVSFHTVKPLDEACLTDVFARFPLVATIEEHSRIGGFGAAVAEWLVDTRVDAAAVHPLRHAGRLLQAIRASRNLRARRLASARIRSPTRSPTRCDQG